MLVVICGPSNSQQMKYVGIIREHHLAGKQDRPKPVSPTLNSEETGMVLSYLENGGSMFAVTLQVVKSFATGEVIGGVSFITDGFWIWPSYFGHYLTKSLIGVPRDFLEYIMEHSKSGLDNHQKENLSSAVEFHKTHFQQYLEIMDL